MWDFHHYSEAFTNKKMGLAKQTAPPYLQQLTVLSDSLLLHIVLLKNIHPAIPPASCTKIGRQRLPPL
jgi:hypothetical protein